MLLVFASCQKEDVTIDETNLSIEEGVRFIEPNKDVMSRGTSVVNGMLEFPDQATFLITIDNLETQDELYDDSFMADWGHLKEADLEDKEDELRFDPQQPFIDFENQFSGFKSLRAKIEGQIIVWLDNSTLDDKTDPDDHFIFDEEVRAVLNEEGQVKIGKPLFQMTRYGYVEVTDGDYNKLALVATSDASKLNLQNVIIE